MSKRAELRMVWSKRDGHMLHNLLTYGAGFVVADRDELARRGAITGTEMIRRLREELERRGYDPDTLTISVRRKREPTVTPVYQKQGTERPVTDATDDLRPSNPAENRDGPSGREPLTTHRRRDAR